MHPTTLLLLFSSLLTITLAAPLIERAGSGVDITVYQGINCQGKKHLRANVIYDDPVGFRDSPASKSYRLSKDLAADDYLTFGSARPFVAKGQDAKKGCHTLKDEAFFFLFQKSG